MIVYVDVLFVKEILINFFLILCTNKITNNSCNNNKMVVSSLIGAIYTIFCLIYPYKFLIYARALIALLMVLVGTKPENISEYVKNVFVYYAISFFISGISYYTYQNKIDTLIYIILATVILFHLIDTCIEKYKISNYICTIKITINNKTEIIKGLIDTGNSLKSVRKQEVIVVSPRIIDKIGDDEIKAILLDEKISKINHYMNLFQIVKYKSLGGNHLTKYGIILKNVEIYHENKKIVQDAVIISANENFSNFDALVSLSILKGGNKNGNNNAYKRKSENVFSESS